MVLRKPANWTKYIRRSYKGNLRKHPVSAGDNWRRWERYYTTVSPIIASTAVSEAWRHHSFDSLDKALRPRVKRLVHTIVSRALFSNMTDLPENPSFRDARPSAREAERVLENTLAERRDLVRLLGEARAKLLFKEISSLTQLLLGAMHE